ncbi:MAG: response regulator transcription factor [Lachnospiraceae bacterium]|nr:response regulator transcription factor [Lachnospiraceae bacterium]
MPYHILIIEDDPDINLLLAKILTAAGYTAVQAYSGTEARLLLEREAPDLILLDLMLPGLSGEELLAEIRQTMHSDTPVLILSAKGSLQDKVTLLTEGADDYITKPFEPEEVAARIQAALRRSRKSNNSSSLLSCKRLTLCPDTRKVLVSGAELSLTAREFDLLQLFLETPEKVYSRERLYELVWKGGYYGENNTVNVHVSNLRKKLKAADPEEEYIQTVYGIGFKLCETL